jgi:type III secretion protein X
MSSLLRGSSDLPFFDRGIDDITFKGTEATPDLPDRQGAMIPGLAQRRRLDDLLAVNNLESFLEEAIRPELPDRDILVPANFSRAVDDALATLSRAAQERQAADPQAARSLQRAVRVLTEEVGLRELLRMYRNALLQG